MCVLTNCTNTELIFQWQLENPATPQASHTEIVVATPLVTVDEDMDAETGVIAGSGIWNASDGDFEPLFIRDVVLEAKAYQSSPFPCDTNTIKVYGRTFSEVISISDFV